MKLFKRKDAPATWAQITVVYGDGDRSSFTNLGVAVEVLALWAKLDLIERNLLAVFPSFQCQSIS